MSRNFEFIMCYINVPVLHMFDIYATDSLVWWYMKYYKYRIAVM